MKGDFGSSNKIKNFETSKSQDNFYWLKFKLKIYRTL